MLGEPLQHSAEDEIKNFQEALLSKRPATVCRGLAPTRRPCPSCQLSVLTHAVPERLGLIWIKHASDVARNAAAASYVSLAQLVPRVVWSAGWMNTLLRQPRKDSHHVTSNDLLIGCVGHHRHRMPFDDFD